MNRAAASQGQQGQKASAPAYAAVLAGGQSRRFGGTDKALATLHGQTLLAHVCASLSECEHKLVVAPPERYVSHLAAGWQIRAETRQGEGPLAALETALAWAEAEAHSGWLALCGVDYPLVTKQLWRQLYAHAMAATSTRVVGLRDAQSQPQPMPALYHTSLRPQITAWLESGERRLRRAVEMPALWLEPASLGLSAGALADADTPAELAKLSSRAGVEQG